MIASTLGLVFLPQSPPWLISKNADKEKTKKAIIWLNPGKKNVETTYANLCTSAACKPHNSQPSSPADTTVGTSVDKNPELCFWSRPVIFPLFISLGLMFFQQWSGINAIIFKTVEIFEATASDIDQNLATIIVGIIQFTATFVSIFLVDKTGRRLLLMISGAIMSITVAGLGTVCYLKDYYSSLYVHVNWLPLLTLMLFVGGYSMGFACIPFLMMGELFPSKYRNLLGSLASGFNLIQTFLVVKLFTNIQSWIGYHGIFWVYSGSSLLSCLFIYAFVPETKGKTLEEIEASFQKQTSRQQRKQEIPC